MHAYKVASISSIISTPHTEVDPFSILMVSLNILRQSSQLTPAAFARASTMLPNGIVQLFSETILQVLDTLDQHELRPKKQR